jgi:molecular chaperone HtpG
MAKTRQFKTQSKQLLDLMINSIYTQKEIFLRELISNASDATDKRHYYALTDEKVPMLESYPITIDRDEEARTLTIRDNGIGLTEKELEDHLGVIAQSGSKEFMKKLEAKDVEVIGQFGVGFYSAFMVAQSVEVITRSPFSESAYRWVSQGEATYTIEPAEKDTIGTDIVLHLRPDVSEDDQDFSQYLKEYTLKNLIKKYSDYIRYPIQLTVTEYPEDKEAEAMDVLKTINSMQPLWKKSKNDITQDELHAFYKQHFNDYEDPFHTIDIRVEGTLEYQALLFIPKKPPYDFYQENFERGLQLYSKGVFIQDKNKDLIPEHFRFVKGLVDSADLSLNISREMLQHNRQLQKIASNIEKKIKSDLEKMLANDRDRYVEFYDHYKTTLKYGIYDQYGSKKELLQDLLMFKTNQSQTYITLKEYVERMKENQTHLYYATGKSTAAIEALPQMDLMREKDYEVLYFTDDIDSFMIQMMHQYAEKDFKSIQQGESDLIDESVKKEVEAQEKDHKKLLKALKKALKDDVKDVKLSARLKEAPVCLTSGEGLTLEMERVLAAMPGAQVMKADKILEINPHHKVFEKLQSLSDKDLKDYATLLYHQALLLEGQTIENPQAFLSSLNKIMSQ